MSNLPHRKRGKPLSDAEKWIVVQVFSRCNEERAKSSFVETKDAHTRTSKYTGIGRRQVVEIVSHFKKTGNITPTAIAGNRIMHQTTIPQVAEEHIRKLILDRHVDGEICNSSHIQDLLKQQLGRKVPLRTICDHLQRMGFDYSRTRKKTRSLREKSYVRQQRHTYLHTIQYFRESGYTPVYLDESFLHHYHGHQFSWFDTQTDDYLERPSGKGRRWCFIHAMLENGLVPNAGYIFEAKKSTGDYHNMFNAAHFQEWWNEKLLPNLPGKCVIVIDRATFHLVPEEQIISSKMRKTELQEWLTSKNIPWESHWLKPKLVECVDEQIDKTPIVQKIAEKRGHKGLILPVHHPELNPIELVWALVKNECGGLLRNGIKFIEVREHLEKALSNITPDICRGLCEKVIKKEKEYWKTDVELDNLEQNGIGI
jgi:hypothetical protein